MIYEFLYKIYIHFFINYLQKKMKSQYILYRLLKHFLYILIIYYLYILSRFITPMKTLIKSYKII